MGTKLQYAINPLLAITPNNNSFAANWLDDWNYFPKKEVKEEGTERPILFKFENTTMDDKILQQHNIVESIKKTMLMHDEIFRQQVRELHQLYNVQRRLMDEIGNETKQNQYWVPTIGYKINVQSVTDIPCSREISGIGITDESRAGPSSYRAMKNNKILYEESDVELTLSIGGSTGKMKSINHNHESNPKLGCTDLSTDHIKIREIGSSILIKSGEEELCSGSNSNMTGSSTATIDQQNNKPTTPHWLLEGLRLNRT